MNEITRMQLLAGLITEAEAAHPAKYKAPEGSDRDEKLDKAKELLKKGDKEAAYNLRDKMEKDARSKPDFKNKPRKDSKVDEAKKKAGKNLSKETEAKIRAVATKKGYSFADLKREYVKGLGAFYTSGSRPGMTAHQWAMARVNSASPSKSWADVKKVNEQKKMKISEFRKLIREEIEQVVIEESFMDKIKSLFMRTPVETKLLNSLDLFSNDLLSPGEEKYNIVINKAKEFGMDIDRAQAFILLQKKLAMEIENLK
jgi:hypothetical protein